MRRNNEYTRSDIGWQILVLIRGPVIALGLMTAGKHLSEKEIFLALSIVLAYRAAKMLGACFQTNPAEAKVCGLTPIIES